MVRAKTLQLVFLPLFVLILCLFGGSSQIELWYNIPVRITALLMTLVLIWFAHWRHVAGLSRSEIGFLILIVSIPLVQLIPLPPAIWSLIGDRATLLDLYAQIEVPTPWLPLSLMPTRTFDGFLFLIVPLTGLFCGLASGPQAARTTVLSFAGIGIVAILLGFVQIAQGEGGASYLYSFTNIGSAVGFFANRNHNGAFLACCIPLTYAAIFAVNEDEQGARRQHLIAAGIAALFAIGAFSTQSRAAMALALGAWGASVIFIGRYRTKLTMLVFNATAVLAGLFLVFQDIIMARFGRLDEGFNRAEVYPMLQSMISENWLAGTGIGSFRWAAYGHEDPAILGGSFWNHAHNDWLQIVAEGGLAGLAAIILFCVWLFRNRPAAADAEKQARMPLPYASASYIIIILLLLHSIVDYPVRTSTMAALFGLCCGWLIAARPRQA